MANPGVGSKFVLVNLNNSYGQRSSSSRNLGGENRVQSGGGNGVGGGVGGAGGSGGGMVVLSRSQSSIMGVQKGGPKLSVAPPLNLPSLRKEHEYFDSSSSGGGSAGAGNSRVGARPTSSGIGWTKLAPIEKDSGNDHPVFERSGVGSPKGGLELTNLETSGFHAIGMCVTWQSNEISQQAKELQVSKFWKKFGELTYGGESIMGILVLKYGEIILPTKHKVVGKVDQSTKTMPLVEA